MQDISALCDAAFNRVQFVFADAFVCPDGVVVGTFSPNADPDRESLGYQKDMAIIVKRGGDPSSRSTFEFRPHAAIQLRQLSGRIDGRQTLVVMSEFLALVDGVVTEEVMLAMSTPEGSA